jgi:hypothetical protein
MRSPIPDRFSQEFQELLKSSTAQKRRWFRGVVIAHPRIQDVLSSLLEAIASAEPDTLIFGFGPTHVGKSTLRIKTVKTIVEQSLPELEFDVEKVPIVGVEIPAPGPHSFEWKPTYRLLLHELQEPLIERKRLMCVPDGQSEIGGDIAPRPYSRATRQASVNDCRESYENSLRHRRPVAVLLDDAHYIGQVSGSNLTKQLDLVKSLASRSGTPHVLLGTYQLLPLRNLSDQVASRSVDINFGRYMPNVDDLEAFENIVIDLCLKMPVPIVPSLQDYIRPCRPLGAAL